MLRTKDLFENTCKDCGKVFRTDKIRERLCPTCKKHRKSESIKKNNELHKSLKPKPTPEQNYKRETDALFAFVRRVDRYNKEHGTSLTYGQFVDKVNSGKIKLRTI